jgi:phospholipase D1/2
MYDELKKAGVNDPSEYITFHGLRNWAVLMGKLVNEIIYVHSKLMIVDDMHVICGSANINDRSLLGKRDSELAAVITDREFINSKFNGTRVQVGKYASSLRQKLFKYDFKRFHRKKSSEVTFNPLLKTSLGRILQQPQLH